MMKKILTLCASLTACIALALLAPAASAAYYDCQGGYHSGNPQPGECYKLLAPGYDAGQSSDVQTHTPQGGSGTNYGTQTNTPSTSSGCGTDVFGNPTGDCTDSSSTGSSTQSYGTVTHTPAMSASDYLGRDLSDYGYTETDPNDYYKKYEKRNERRYCARDYCYLVYDWCYDDVHCETRTEKTSRYEYAGDDEGTDSNTTTNGSTYQKNTWNYYKYYINNYFYNNPYTQPSNPTCKYNSRDCIYRGFKFGGYHNGYWYN